MTLISQLRNADRVKIACLAQLVKVLAPIERLEYARPDTMGPPLASAPSMEPRSIALASTIDKGSAALRIAPLSWNPLRFSTLAKGTG